MLVNQGYRYELQPTKGQLSSFRQHAGTARFVYNWGLQERIRIFKENEGKDKFTDAYKQSKAWNIWKRANAPWWMEVSKCVPQVALKNLERAFKNLWRARKVGRKVGFPRFKKRGVYDSFGLMGSLKILNKRKIQLPRLGRIRTKESTEKFKGRIRSATVSREADRWYVSFSVEVERPDPQPVTGPVVGVDVGLTHFAMLSDGIQIEAPKPLVANLHRLQRRSKQHSRKQKGSNNRRKSALSLARLHRRIKNQRKDFLHKLSTRLTRTKQAIVVEDLNVAGMSQNRRLSRSIMDSGWSEFRRMLEYKTAWHGSELVVADRFYPSSKIRSACGTKKDSLALSDRVFKCETCGAEIDRDLNAARNLATLYTGSSPGINACGDGSTGGSLASRETAVIEAGIGCGRLSTF
jgi:putative transposase